MQLNESFRSVDEPLKKLEPADVKKEAQEMVQRHERQLVALKSAHPEGFQDAAMKLTQEFQVQLKEFLHQHTADKLFAEIDANVHREVSRIMGSHIVSSSQ
jgi:hypothetical protein